MKRLLFILILLLLVQGARAQLNNTYTQYTLVPYLNNPAASGMQTVSDFKLVAKRPFGSGETISSDYFMGVNHGLILGNQNSMAGLANSTSAAHKRPLRFGISGLARQRNFNTLTNFGSNIAFSVHVPVTRQHYLSFGMAAGYSQFSVKTQSLIVREAQDSYYTNLLNAGGVTSNLNLNAGMVFYSNNLYIGYSVNGLVNARTDNNLAYNEKPALVHYGMVGYKYYLASSWEFQPSLLFRYQPGLPMQINLSTKFTYQDVAWIGLAYISNQTISLLAGYEISKNLNVGYSYDMSFGSQNSILSNNNELILGFKPFLKEKKTETPEE